MRSTITMMQTLAPVLLFTALLAGCAIHKDFLYTFTATGRVSCAGPCAEVTAIVVRVVDTGLDYKRRHARFEIAKHPTVIGEPFMFNFDYSWGYTKFAGTQRPRRVVTIEALAPGCRTAVMEMNIDAEPNEDAHFTLEASNLTIDCTQ